jgi:hypothetical protein
MYISAFPISLMSRIPTSSAKSREVALSSCGIGQIPVSGDPVSHRLGVYTERVWKRQNGDSD